MGDSHGRSRAIHLCGTVTGTLQSKIGLTLYSQGGHYKLLLVLPHEYPFKPPTLSFQTKIYHPNVSNDDKGSMCLGILRSDAWKPPNKISAVLNLARNLLIEPNPDDAVEASIADQFKNNKKEFEKTAKDWVKRYAK
jgi:ubiquitin-protein ligase